VLSDLVMLVSAVLAALAAGVLIAYGVCVAMFGFFRMQARQVVVKPTVRATSVVEG
jgi:hypothetical protein